MASISVTIQCKDLLQNMFEVGTVHEARVVGFAKPAVDDTTDKETRHEVSC